MCIAFPATTGFSVAMDSTLHLGEVKITNTSSCPPVPPPLGVLVHSLLDVCVSKCMLCCSVVSDSSQESSSPKPGGGMGLGWGAAWREKAVLSV